MRESGGGGRCRSDATPVGSVVSERRARVTVKGPAADGGRNEAVSCFDEEWGGREGSRARTRSAHL